MRIGADLFVVGGGGAPSQADPGDGDRSRVIVPTEQIWAGRTTRANDRSGAAAGLEQRIWASRSMVRTNRSNGEQIGADRRRKVSGGRPDRRRNRAAAAATWNPKNGLSAWIFY